MRNEAEIRDKVIYYQGMLTAVSIGRSVISPRVFAALSEHFPDEAMSMLRLSQEIDEGIDRLPPGDRAVFRQAFEHHAWLLQRVLAEKVSALRWTLGEEQPEGVGDPGGGQG